MHCPRCHAEPPRDPFVCTSCGERLLTYVDEPLGPGSGVRAEELGVGVGAAREPAGAAAVTRGAAGASRASGTPGRTDGARGAGRTAPSQPGAARPGRPADTTTPLVQKGLIGLFIAGIVLLRWPLGGLLQLVAMGVILWRWPRMSFIPFTSLMIAVGAALWIVAEIVDEVSPEDFFPLATPTPTIQRSFATSTPPRPAGTPTLLPAQQTATATVVAGESRVLVAHARARWLRGDTQGALAAIEQALRLSPGQSDALNLRALIRVAAGDYAGAVEDAQRVTIAQPATPTYHDTYAYALLKQGRPREALQEYDRALSGLQRDDRAASLLGRGLALHGLARLDDAARDIQAGLRLLPDVDPDPQLADLEVSARRTLAGLPAASPGASPAASPAALLGTPVPAGRAP